MNSIEYAALAAKTAQNDIEGVVARVRDPKGFEILHGAIGAATESGELLEQVKKHIIYGKDLDFTNLIEEVGDVIWYLQRICEGGDFTIEQAMEANIAKLAKRYPSGFFDLEDSNNRDTDAERKAIDAVGEDKAHTAAMLKDEKDSVAMATQLRDKSVDHKTVFDIYEKRIKPYGLFTEVYVSAQLKAEMTAEEFADALGHGCSEWDV